MKHLRYQKSRNVQGTIEANESVEGESIEKRVQRILNDAEPITDKAPYIETESKLGVQAKYDIRADKFELAIDEIAEMHRQGAEGYQEQISKGLTEGLTDEGGKEGEE